MKKLLQKLTTRALVAGTVLVAGGWLLTGCQTANEVPPFSPVPDEPGDQSLSSAVSAAGSATGSTMPDDFARFGKDELVRVTFSGTPTPILPHEERVKEDGMITLPDIGSIKAEGKTVGELQKAIHDKYVPDFYTRLTVTVSSDRRLYYVSGYVKLPGRQEYIGTATVLKAISSAGDFNDFADRKHVVLTRADGTRHIVNCIKAAFDSSYDLPVFPGDKIEVPMRKPWTLW